MQNIIRIRPAEYRWIKNVISLANRNKYVKNAIMKDKMDIKSEHALMGDIAIDKDGHSGGTMAWSLTVSRTIFVTNAKIIKHNSGLAYPNLLSE
jgi:hypothetical protein